ncbi:MAG TPA: carboxymuconolactone decarboxylase family protein [Burkholderiales bacterium]|nr:carboxymuconolactone decarboxylase family protein [Burkholderiales bacterium]
MAATTKRGARMAKLDPAQMTEDQKAAAAELAAGPRGEVRGPFNVMLRSPGLMSPLQKVGEYLRFKCEVDRRIAEMATLIAARQLTQNYEWSAHYPLALKAGLKADVADAIAEGRRPRGMAEDEEIAYDLLTELFTNRCVSDATYDRAVAKFGERNVVDIVAIGGYYQLLGMLMNTARTQLPEGKEPGMPHFPN